LAQVLYVGRRGVIFRSQFHDIKMNNGCDGKLPSEAALQAGLPMQLRERTRLAKAGKIKAGCVVYWMRLALRGHENPALDAAIIAAKALEAPLVVLLQIEDQYPHATARRQMFLLQGAQCAQAELARRGVPVAVQIDRRGHRPEPVLTLAKSASLVIAEEPFCVPWLSGAEKLQHGEFQCPVWLIDCSSVVPSALVSKQSCHRAYVYENATRRLHEARISKPWEDAQPQSEPMPEDLGVESLNLANTDLAALIAEMDIDQTVKPVEHTIGGSTHGYARWLAWIAAGGLKTYAKRRNESLDVHGVSRMSAYLNAGMVSPLRLAREAAAASGAGKGKFLNEFLTWRGLTYAWCYHYPMASSGCTLSQLPSWASETLRRHASDPRTVLGRNRLAKACSGDRAWDGMQRYLVETGELHNNARMGWGCAIPKWTASPEDAMHTLIDLNNTFALDGHAPPSYGGLLGCLGLFSGPKGESAIFGKVSARPPKAKYAGMPSQIPALLAGLAGHALTQASSPQMPMQQDSPASRKAHSKAAITSSSNRTLPESFERVWKKKASGGGVEAEHYSKIQDYSGYEDDSCSRKRRWSNLKTGSEEAVLIELD